MEKILINRGKPSKVLENNETHYFYWPVEFGLPYFKIRNRTIPFPFPLKSPDYEPIKTLTIKNSIIVLSRFHYHVLVYFNQPLLKNGKPVADFYRGSHSPFIYPDWTSSESTVGTKIFRRLGSTIDTMDINGMTRYIAFYTQIFNGSIKKGLPSKLKDYEIEKGDVPADSLFKPCDSKAIIWFGLQPSTEEEDYISNLPC